MPVAILAHAVVTVVVSVMPPSSPPPSFARTDEATFVIDVAPAPRSIVEGAATASPGAPAGERGVGRAPRGRAFAVEAPSESTNEPAVAWSFASSGVASPREIGIGTLWQNVAASELPRPAVERSIRDAIAADDVEKGIGRAGALVSVVHEAASSSSAPDVGTTTIEVVCDPNGTVVAARPDNAAWDEVTREIVRLMKGRALRATAHGLRASLRVVAEHAPPSGTRGGSSLGAVPDDAPGGTRACEGAGLTRRCVAGLPLGLTNAGHDTSNLGAVTTRVVHVQLLSER